MIPFLILSALSTACTIDEVRRCQSVALRYEAHKVWTGYGESMDIDAINAADMAYEAHLARCEGNIAHAMRCEAALDRILSNHGF